ncbi:hypothetical protein GF361_00100 [Candidatus Woesearchaeota archaeon]|nr:hypothetical protein [Candidatus Woesearchaeota archaeon]
MELTDLIEQVEEIQNMRRENDRIVREKGGIIEFREETGISRFFSNMVIPMAEMERNIEEMKCPNYVLYVANHYVDSKHYLENPCEYNLKKSRAAHPNVVSHVERNDRFMHKIRDYMGTEDYANPGLMRLMKEKTEIELKQLKKFFEGVDHDEIQKCLDECYRRIKKEYDLVKYK